MVLVIVNGQIWFKNLVKIWLEKIWSKSGCKKSGQNLVKIWFDRNTVKKCHFLPFGHMFE